MKLSFVVVFALLAVAVHRNAQEMTAKEAKTVVERLRATRNQDALHEESEDCEETPRQDQTMPMCRESCSPSC